MIAICLNGATNNKKNSCLITFLNYEKLSSYIHEVEKLKNIQSKRKWNEPEIKSSELETSMKSLENVYLSVLNKQEVNIFGAGTVNETLLYTSPKIFGNELQAYKFHFDEARLGQTVQNISYTLSPNGLQFFTSRFDMLISFEKLCDAGFAMNRLLQEETLHDCLK